ncbi:hypothetical protein PIROE2DRAFT_4407 [Piromyces sp. E2]|nr:hypothetical protein PIROE2DRAFT_4407 [Piromyces sp. E2]|eukprot:OUM67990.1 hypothetical protein PIROE2DRAFT_4407 [Piromyces sp. E2]
MNKSVLKFVALVNGLMAVGLSLANPVVNISLDEIESGNNNYDYTQNNYGQNDNTQNNYGQQNNDFNFNSNYNEYNQNNNNANGINLNVSYETENNMNTNNNSYDSNINTYDNSDNTYTNNYSDNSNSYYDSSVTNNYSENSNNYYNNNNNNDNTNNYYNNNDNTNNYYNNNDSTNNYYNNNDNTNNYYNNNSNSNTNNYYNNNIENTNNYYNNNMENTNNYNTNTFDNTNSYNTNTFDNTNIYNTNTFDNTNVDDIKSYYNYDDVDYTSNYNSNEFENTNVYNGDGYNDNISYASNNNENYLDTTNINPNDFVKQSIPSFTNVKFQKVYPNYDTFKATWIYHTKSNLCLTYYKIGYKLRLESCNPKNVYQKWYVPIEGKNYWILGTTLSPVTNKNVMSEVNVETNTIEQYFDYNTICLYTNSKGSFLSRTCIENNAYSGIKMDPINFGSSENVIKSSNINTNNCVDVISEDLTNYNQHLKDMNISTKSGISPLDLSVDSIRLTMGKCSNSDTQKWSFFVDFPNLQNFQKVLYNPNNYSTITELKSDVSDVFLKPKESKNINIEIYAGKKKINNYSNIKLTVANKKIAEVKTGKANSNISVTGKSVGTTTLTVQLHKKQLIFNIIVSDATDKVAFLDIQTFKDNIGDCIVIQSTNAKGNPIFAMIDTGKGSALSYEKMLGYLKANNVKQLEWLLISHFHGDHVGGMDKLLESGVKIKKILTKQYHGLDSTVKGNGTVANFRKTRMQDWNKMIKTINNKKVPIAYIAPNKNDKLQLGNYKFTLFNVDEAFKDYDKICAQFKNCNENTNSVIAVAENNGKYYYFNGDIDTLSNSFSKSKDEKLKKAYNQRTVDKWVSKAMKTFNIKHFDVMKASHHGTLYNNIKNAYVVGKPDYCVVTNAKQGLRDRKNILEKRFKAGNKNVKIYYTGNGIVTVNQNKKGNISVIQGRDEHNERE